MIGRLLPHFAAELEAGGIRAETIRQRVSIIAQLADAKYGVTPQAVSAYCRARQLSPGTLYQYHSVASTFTRWALECGVVDDDPFDGAPRPPKPRYRARPAATDEIAFVLEQAREPMRSWATLAAYAGLRCVEIARVAGRDLVKSRSGYVLRVPEGKGGRPGEVPAHPIIVALLSEADAGRVWPRASPQKVSQKANGEMKRLGVSCRMHELRHAFATELYRQTRDVLTVQHALRHEQLETTAGYIAFDDELVRSAIGGLSFSAA